MSVFPWSEAWFLLTLVSLSQSIECQKKFSPIQWRFFLLYSMNDNSSRLFLANSNSFGLCLTICSEEALLPRQTEIVSINSETGSTLRPDKVLYRAQRLLPVPVALSRHKKVSGIHISGVSSELTCPCQCRLPTRWTAAPAASPAAAAEGWCSQAAPWAVLSRIIRTNRLFE